MQIKCRIRDLYPHNKKYSYNPIKKKSAQFPNGQKIYTDFQIQRGHGSLQSTMTLNLALKNKCPPSQQMRKRTDKCIIKVEDKCGIKKLQCTKVSRGQEGHFIIVYRSEPGYK